MAATKDFDDAALKRRLTPEQYRVLREGGTERPFANKYFDFDEQGTYYCAACGQPLFKSDTKYRSNQWGLEGWPSFAGALDNKALKLVEDTSYGMRRTEVKCANCDSHLGHLFPDYSSPSGQHYCINSAALEFKDKS